MDLKEKDVYIDSITRRLQQSLPSPKKAISYERIPQGKVQTIVRQMSHDAAPSNCKCGFDNCECGNMSQTGSKCGQMIESSSDDSACSAIVNKISTSGGFTSQEQSKCDVCDEIAVLRRENAELSQELECYKAKLVDMETCMCEIEKQRDSNSSLEEEVAKLSSVQAKEMESLRSSFESAMSGKDEELCQVEHELSDATDSANKLKEKLKLCCEELQELRPLRDQCCQLEKQLKHVQSEACRSKEKLMRECDLSKQETVALIEQIRELQIELDEQQKRSQDIVGQLRNRQSADESKQIRKSEESIKQCDFLLKCLRDLKKHYDDMKADKVSMIKLYEKQIHALENENGSLRKRSVSDRDVENCGDVLLRNIAKHGLGSLRPDELIELHNRVSDDQNISAFSTKSLFLDPLCNDKHQASRRSNLHELL